MYKFDIQHAIGTTGEARLDQIFRPFYLIQPASPEQQRQGIDRLVINRATGEHSFIEYKTDHRAGDTGNAFVETISVDTIGKPGWAYTSQARYLIYYIPDPETIYILPMAQIRYTIDRWRKLYPQRRIPNISARGHRYHTIGTLVPLLEFERIAIQVL